MLNLFIYNMMHCNRDAQPVIREFRQFLTGKDYDFCRRKNFLNLPRKKIKFRHSFKNDKFR